MPNWVSNVFSFDSVEDLEKVYKGMMFDVIVYGYDKYNNYTNVRTEKKWSFRAVLDYPKEVPPGFERKKEDRITCDLNCPGINWYKWNNCNWGVKWDATNVSAEGLCLYFDTAWSPINDELVEAIKNKFNVEFIYDWLDESDIEEE